MTSLIIITHTSRLIDCNATIASGSLYKTRRHNKKKTLDKKIQHVSTDFIVLFWDTLYTGDNLRIFFVCKHAGIITCQVVTG